MLFRILGTTTLISLLTSCGGSSGSHEVSASQERYEFSDTINVIENQTDGKNGASIIKETFEYIDSSTQNLKKYDMVVLSADPEFSEAFLHGRNFKNKSNWTVLSEQNPIALWSKTYDIRVFGDENFEHDISGEFESFLIDFEGYYDDDSYVLYFIATTDETNTSHNGIVFAGIEGTTLGNKLVTDLDLVGYINFSDVSNLTGEIGTFTMNLNLDRQDGSFDAQSLNYIASAEGISFNSDQNLFSSQSAQIGLKNQTSKNAELIGSLYGRDGDLVGGMIFTDLNTPETGYLGTFIGYNNYPILQ